jgi:hypothetical protein
MEAIGETFQLVLVILLGIIGEYLGRIYDEVYAHPLSIVIARKILECEPPGSTCPLQYSGACGLARLSTLYGYGVCYVVSFQNEPG